MSTLCTCLRFIRLCNILISGGTHLGSLRGGLRSFRDDLGSFQVDLGLPRATWASAGDELEKNLGFGLTILGSSRHFAKLQKAWRITLRVEEL
jgi:hypothetical protein